MTAEERDEKILNFVKANVDLTTPMSLGEFQKLMALAKADSEMNRWQILVVQTYTKLKSAK